MKRILMMDKTDEFESLPVRGRGLKLNERRVTMTQIRSRSPCGGVD